MLKIITISLDLYLFCIQQLLTIFPFNKNPQIKDALFYVRSLEYSVLLFVLIF